MKIKIGDKIYDSSVQPIMVIFTDKDKENIANMPKENYHYCEYDEKKYTPDEILKWMDETDAVKF